MRPPYRIFLELENTMMHPHSLFLHLTNQNLKTLTYVIDGTKEIYKKSGTKKWKLVREWVHEGNPAHGM